MPKQQPRSVGISSLQALDEVANGSSAFKLGERTGRAVAAGGTVEEDFPASAASICHDASPMGPKKNPPLMQGSSSSGIGGAREESSGERAIEQTDYTRTSSMELWYHGSTHREF
ncbi:hypothetical protein T310_0774 [Rasamsonia emersonii CBS 393.64]|uniref:Uncharacterized protein n=1 Tax=Rasamsonia emersonii (strain ATCC 16479 / CBS 393.64 / IMI 116815) TaxID=1408163 RepID=A0A0F4Z5P0_RASE3|nr:hypothetical protein T310_0774 [Rasamsonia emersonii CBS 393.64]KKA25183.1 hypothetical protein T310_0774 [Rasamsonia emersonii CBS 393.64]